MIKHRNHKDGRAMSYKRMVWIRRMKLSFLTFVIFGTMAAGVSKLNETLAWIDTSNAEPVIEHTFPKFVGTPKVEASVTVEAKIEELKKQVRDRMMHFESSNDERGDDDLLFTLDFQDKDQRICTKEGGDYPLRCLSFGPYQFKIDTIIHWEKKLNDRVVDEWEALRIAHDVDQASKLFDDIVYRVKGGIFEWETSYRKDPAYFDAMVDAIRTLEDIEV